MRISRHKSPNYDSWRYFSDLKMKMSKLKEKESLIAAS